MSTYTKILYHIVFTTKNRKRILEKENRVELFKYIWGLLQNKSCHLYQINGIEDHIHIITHIHPSISISSLVKDIKVASSKYIKDQHLFRHFEGWQDGYGAFTYSSKELKTLIQYVQNQEMHHKKRSFKEEYLQILMEHGIEPDPRYF